MALTASKLNAINMKKNLIDLTYMYQGGPTDIQGRSKNSTERSIQKNYERIVFRCPELEIHAAIFCSKAFKMGINLAISVYKKEGKEIKRKTLLLDKSGPVRMLFAIIAHITLPD